jgi:hypothetical protein
MAAALLVAGTAIQIYGQQQAAEAQANQARQDAAAKQAQAAEIMRRLPGNLRAIEEQGAQLVGAQEMAMSQGVTIGEGSPLIILEQTMHNVRREMNNAETESVFRASQLQLGAAASSEYSGQVKRAADIGSFGTILTNGFSAYANRSTLFPKGKPDVTGTSTSVENYNGRTTSSGQWGYGPGNRPSESI